MNEPQHSRLRRAFGFLSPHRFAVGTLAFTAMLVAIVGAVEPLILKSVFDQLTQGHAVRGIVIGIGALAVLSVFRELANGISNWLTWRTRLHVHYALLEATVGR